MEEFYLKNILTDINDTDNEDTLEKENYSHLEVDENLKPQITNIYSKPENYYSNRKASCGMGTTDDKTLERRDEQYERSRYDYDYVGVIEKEDYRYIGHIHNEVREGFGICYYKNYKYIGQWRNNMKNGYGKIIYDSGDVSLGEFVDDVFEGYCEQHFAKGQNFIKGIFSQGKFIDVVVVKTDTKIYEGDVISYNKNFNPDNSNVSIGKLYSMQNRNNFFYGEVLNYKEECGYGYLKKNSLLYLGEQRSKMFLNYIEVFSHDGACFFSLVKNGVRNGLSFNFAKDSKVCYGKYLNDHRNGPFIYFSNCHNIPKSSVKTEIYHSGFKSKVVDKMDASRKYLNLNYPEYAKITEINYTEIIAKFNCVIAEEMPFCLKMLNREEPQHTA